MTEDRARWANVRITGHVAGPGPITFTAAAARVPDSSRIATAWIATCGQFGADAVPAPGLVTGRNDMLIASLRAVSRGLERLRKDHLEEDMRIMCGNSAVAQYLCWWQQGQAVIPDGYTLERAGGKPSSLEWLIGELGSYGDSYEIYDVPASTGLAGAAKDLARVTTEAAAMAVTIEDLRAGAAELVARALTRWNAEVLAAS